VIIINEIHRDASLKENFMAAEVFDIFYIQVMLECRQIYNFVNENDDIYGPIKTSVRIAKLM